MRAKVKRAKREASKLHGATASWVSLVDAGANETPFTLIKSKDGVTAMSIKKRNKGKAGVKKSHKTVNPQRKKAAEEEVKTETLIAKMVFDGELFETEEAVTEYLEKADWEAEETSIVKNDNGNWEVRPDGLEDDDFSRIAKVDVDEEGVEAFVGLRELKSEDADDADDDAADDDEETVAKEDDDEDGEDDDEADDEDDDEDEEADEVAKSKKPVKKAIKPKPAKLSKRAQFLAKRAEERQSVAKFDAWDAKWSKSNSIAKALEAGMEWDGVPPGYYEVQAAFNGVAANIVGNEDFDAAGKQEALNKAALDFAEIIGGLDTFFDAYVGEDAESVAKAYEDEGKRDQVAKWAGEYADFAAGETPETETVSKQEKVSKSAGSEGESVTATTIAALISKAVEPLTEQIEGVSGKVEKMASRRPSKKAADAEDNGGTSPRKLETKSAEDAALEEFAKSTFG